MGASRLRVNNIQGSFPPGIRRLEREADQSPSPDTEVINKWSYTPTPSISLHGLYNDRFTVYQHLRSDANSPFYQTINLFYANILKYTYLLTPCNRVLLEKLTGSQPVKKFPAFYGTRRFITAFTSARHLSLT